MQSTIMHHWSLDVETAACMLRGLVDGLLVVGGGCWLPHVCGPGTLCDVVLRQLVVGRWDRWVRMEVVLRLRGPGVRQCLPRCFC